MGSGAGREKSMDSLELSSLGSHTGHVLSFNKYLMSTYSVPPLFSTWQSTRQMRSPPVLMELMF